MKAEKAKKCEFLGEKFASPKIRPSVSYKACEIEIFTSKKTVLSQKLVTFASQYGTNKEYSI